MVIKLVVDLGHLLKDPTKVAWEGNNRWVYNGTKL